MNHSDICKHCLEGWGEHEALKNYCPKYDDGGGLYYDKSQTFERLNIREVVAKVSEQEKEIERLEKEIWELKRWSVHQELSEQSQRIQSFMNKVESRMKELAGLIGDVQQTKDTVTMARLQSEYGFLDELINN